MRKTTIYPHNFITFLITTFGGQFKLFFGGHFEWVFQQAFYGCNSSQMLPELNTTKATQFTNFINGCTALERIEGIDFSSSQTEINIGQNLYTKLNALSTSGEMAQSRKASPYTPTTLPKPPFRIL